MNKNDLLNLLRTNRFWAKKSLGQNFLIDDKALEKIVEAGEIQPEDMVIEIGPGMGALTERLIDSKANIISIELDQELAEYIQDKFKIYNNLEFKNNAEFEDLKIKKSSDIKISKLKIIHDDILKVNIPELIGDRRYKVIANIPYYITSKIIRIFLEQRNKPETMVLLVQKEVAERICAKPGDMSVLAVSVQYYGQPTIIDIVPANSFFPVPKVDSAILKIIVGSRKSEVGSEEKDFFRCVNIGFSSKRKTLVNNLSAGYGLDKEKVADILLSVGLSDKTRAQELSIEDWKNLCQRL